MNTNLHRGGLFRAIAASACLLCAAGPVMAQIQIDEQVRIMLASGDVLTGTLIAETRETITVFNDIFGEVTIQRAGIASMEAVALPEAAAPPAGEEEAPPADEEAPPVEEAEKKPWEIRFELGASGSRGNTDRDNVRAAISAVRDTDRMATLVAADYRWAAEEGATTENRFFIRGRNEWKIADSKWSYFVQGDADIDEFKDYNVRVSLFGGLGYRFIDTDEEKFKVRAGLGASRPFGAPEADRWVFEGLFGVDYYRKLSESVNFTATAEYFPDFEDTREFRARGEAALEIALNNEKTWFLRLNVEDRYESNVGPDADKNDFYYGAAILLVF